MPVPLDGVGQPVRQGIEPAGAVPAITLPALLTDPLAAVRNCWDAVLDDAAVAVELLEAVRDARSDTTVAADTVEGAGTAEDPWRLALIGPLALELSRTGSRAVIALAADFTGGHWENTGLVELLREGMLDEAACLDADTKA